MSLARNMLLDPVIVQAFDSVMEFSSSDGIDILLCALYCKSCDRTSNLVPGHSVQAPCDLLDIFSCDLQYKSHI